jgi:DNA-directed RNA polymerase subunit L
MKIDIIKDEKNVLEVELENLTIAELLRVYLNDAGAKLAVWRREHPTKNPILHIEGDNPKKLLKSTITTLEKEIDTLVDDFKKLK